MLNSDILVNIGNATKYQLPSKLVEYVSTGKPILNITSILDDSSDAFLSSYPMAKTVCLGKDDDVASKVEETVLFLDTAFPLDNEHRNIWIEKYSVQNIGRQYIQFFN